MLVLQSLQSEAFLADTTNPTMAHTLQGSWVNTDGVYQGDNEVGLVGDVVSRTVRKEMFLESTPTSTAGIQRCAGLGLSDRVRVRVWDAINPQGRVRV